MGTSLPISIFAGEPQIQRRPYSYLVSGFTHLLGAGLILYGFIFAPRINLKDAADRYTLREVTINMPYPVTPHKSEDSAMYPGQKAAAHTDVPHSQSAAAPSSRLQVPKLHLAEHTIVQPDVPVNQLMIKHAALPSLLLWSAQRPKLELITPPQPQKLAWVDTKPVLTRPTPDQNIAELPITSTPFSSKMPMPMPGSSNPVVIRGQMPSNLIPETSSMNSSNPSAAAMLSISEEQLAKGSIALPPVNQTASGNENGAMRAGDAGNSAVDGHGAPNSRGNSGNSMGRAGAKDGMNAGNGLNAGKGNGGGPKVNGQGGEGSEPTYTRIKLPTNGQYGVVVVGSSMEDQFPETSQLWGGRLVYSVFLHVGLAKNWILQYSLPPTGEAAVAGNLNKIEAPWPYYIVRPSQSPVVAADALMIHGFVNQAGHFEALAVVFPSGFREAQYVIQALRQWQFRPAKHDGQIAKVEVLLIIPEDSD